MEGNPFYRFQLLAGKTCPPMAKRRVKIAQGWRSRPGPYLGTWENQAGAS